MTAATVTRSDVRRAAGDLYEDSEFDLWFASPQALLEGMSPAQMVDAGRGAEITRMLRQIEEGAFL